MRNFYPKGKNLPALERNVLKYRSIEMLLVLFKAEHIKSFIIDTLITTEEFRSLHRNVEPKITRTTKRVFQKALEILIDDQVLSIQDADLLKEIIDYRNNIAHDLHALTADLSTDVVYTTSIYESKKFDSGKLIDLEKITELIYKNMASKYIMPLQFSTVVFSSIEKTYKKELKILSNKIQKQIKTRLNEINTINKEIDSLSQDDLKLLNEPIREPNQTISKHGVKCIYYFFQKRLKDLTICHVLQINYKTIKKYKNKWLLEQKVKNT
jgi:hypothetical protein